MPVLPCAATRTCASTPRSPGGTPTAATPSWPWSTSGYAYRLPAGFTDDEAAPLLCAGIIGFRALRRAALPPGGRLGIYGFGASAHLAAQVALAEGATVHVMTRSAEARQLALRARRGVGRGHLRPAAGAARRGHALRPGGEHRAGRPRPPWTAGGTLAIAGIHLSDIPSLRYAEHLFQERQVRSVTANTRRDGEEFLAIAARSGCPVTTVPYRFDEADRALADLAHDEVTGAAVVHVSERS